ncbi:MAG TPA: hypothetical protein VL242_28755, partial [Sorangium sp.]|nr:hypothetical protein [Sorangium sp.]
PDAHAAFQAAATERLAKLVPEAKRGQLHRKELVRERPDLMVGAIACGDTVGAAEAFGSALKRQRNRNLMALEMESGGLLAAVHAKADLSRTLVIRGISDCSDERKKELDRIGAGALRRYAMGNAIELLWQLLELGALPRHSS